MTRTNVLILEDEKYFRNMLRDGLRSEGFQVAPAATPEEATQRAAELGNALDVALIDVDLKSTKNGLEVAMEIRQGQREWPPEFLVISGRDRPEYYQSAFALGAAGYLRKGEYDADPNRPSSGRPLLVPDVADHVRMLALRRALHGPAISERLRQIAEASRSHEDTATRFCRDLLWAELDAGLAGRFVLLLGTEGGTACYPGSSFDFSPAARFEWVEQLVHLRLGDPDPLVIKGIRARTWLPKLEPEDQAGAELAFELLDGLAFVPFGETKTARLALGVGAHGNSEALPRARLVDCYLRQSVIHHLLEITDTWAELDAKRRALIRATSEFCLYQGQELEELLREAEAEATGVTGDKGEEREAVGEFPTAKLYAVAEELRDAGELLVHFDVADQSEAAETGRRIDLAELTRAVLADDLAQDFRTAGIKVELHGECAAIGRRDRLGSTILQVLSWLARRVVRTQCEGERTLAVKCKSVLIDGGRAQIVFEELLSRRLSQSLREALFAPFFSRPFAEPAAIDGRDKGRRLGLFLARALAESEGGALHDRSDEIPGDRGHRFLLELPLAEL